MADLDEVIEDGETPVGATTRLAIEKAQVVAARRGVTGGTGDDGQVVLAADTTVVVDRRILGKPASEGEAAEMLLSLSGRNHVVLTGWALLRPGSAPETAECGVSRSVVRMREISRREAEAYASTGEPMDKAGAYAAQGQGRRFIGAITGDLDNVIGLPMAPVAAALSRAGIRPG